MLTRFVRGQLIIFAVASIIGILATVSYTHLTLPTKRIV